MYHSFRNKISAQGCVFCVKVISNVYTSSYRMKHDHRPSRRVSEHDVRVSEDTIRTAHISRVRVVAGTLCTLACTHSCTLRRFFSNTQALQSCKGSCVIATLTTASPCTSATNSAPQCTHLRRKPRQYCTTEEPSDTALSGRTTSLHRL